MQENISSIVQQIQPEVTKYWKSPTWVGITIASLAEGSRAVQEDDPVREEEGSESRNLLICFSAFVRFFPSEVRFIRHPDFENKDLRMSSNDEAISGQSLSTFSSRYRRKSR